MVNLEEILNKHFNLYTTYSVKNKEGKFVNVVDKIGALEAMKEACRQVLELAAENAELDSEDENDMTGVIVSVNRQSITDTINQVE